LGLQKGNTYGSILVDLEKRKPIDLLPDRKVETVKNWLETYPSIEIISRDRASCYSQAAELGTSYAIQVAERWHFLINLGEALKRFLDKHNQELRLAAKDIAQNERDQEQGKPASSNPASAIKADSAKDQKTKRLQRRSQLYQGMS